ncbi:MAG: hypothetical protein NTW66_00805 [Candidatus Magasanikbacteria bacterium]|nr:hypothetical protein [Candidatus Magasanikbacteria bacterium]
MFNSLRAKGKILWNIVKPHRRLGLLSAVFLITAAFVYIFVVGPQVFAVDLGLADAIMGKIGELFLWLATKLLSLTVFILKFVIEIASYNNYINSGAVTLGWILVRDVTNMFFVIILMVIAFGTVLGIEQYEWKKLLVKFVMAAVLVNFSRVICGVIIDAAQVFMMTFISGVAAVAGGNLITALKLESILSFSKNTNAEAMKNMNVVVTALFAFIFAFATVVVMGAYLVVLIGRAITLWVLVILSPLAFVLSVIPKTQSYASQWWSEFSNHVIVGPVLAFFLWLAFAVAGGTNIHSEFSNPSNSAYPMTDPSAEAAAIVAMGSSQAEDTGTNLNAVMEWDNMAGFIIAVALLLAGVKVSQKLGTAGAGVLGAAGGAVTGFAMAATGVTAAKWAAREGYGAVKKAGMKRIEFAKLKAGNALRAGSAAWNVGSANLIKKVAGEGRVGQFLTNATQFGTFNSRIEEAQKQRALYDKLHGSSVQGNLSQKQKTADLEAKVKLIEPFKQRAIARREEKAMKNMSEEERDLYENAPQAGLEAEAIRGRMAEEEKLRKGVAQEELETGTTKAGKEFIAMRNDTMNAKIEADQIRNKLGSEEQLKELRRIEELLKDKGSSYTNRQNALYSGRAEGDYRKLNMSRQERDRISGSKAAYLEGQGQDILALQERTRNGAAQVKDLTDDYAGMDQASYKTVAAKLGDQMAKLRSQGLSSAEFDAQAAPLMASRAALTAAAANHGADTARGVRDILLDKANYTGDRTADGSAEMLLAELSGADTGAMTAGEMSHVEEMIGPDIHSRNAMLKAIKDARWKAATTSGDIGLAMSISDGVQENASGEKMLVYGIGSNVGTEDTKGNKHAPGSRAHTAANAKAKDYLMDHVSLKDASDASHIIIRTPGAAPKIDFTAVEAAASSVASATAQNIGTGISKPVVKEMGAAAVANEIKRPDAQRIIKIFASKMKNNAGFKQWVALNQDIWKAARYPGGGDPQTIWKAEHP